MDRCSLLDYIQKRRWRGRLFSFLHKKTKEYYGVIGERRRKRIRKPSAAAGGKKSSREWR
jgi:hypothetical protein